MSDRWHIYYCPESDDLHLWTWVIEPQEEFQAENVHTGKTVQMIYIGEL